MFCPKCDNLLDISRTDKSDISTPDTNENIKKIIDTNVSYYTCKTCFYSKQIETGQLIMSKQGKKSKTNYINLDLFKNKIYSNVLPYTRDYSCANQNCVGNKDIKQHEAVMYRMPNSMQIMYTCCACQSVWLHK